MALTFLVAISVLKRLGHPEVRAVVEPLVETTAVHVHRALNVQRLLANAASAAARSPTC